jgi:L-ascorbate metabolism protein UlaG (beta-lactamase superfamily)
MIKKVLKKLGLLIGIVLLLIIVIGVAFLSLSPQFGGKVSEEQKAIYAKTGHYENGIFLNDEEIAMELNCHSITAMIKETTHPDPNFVPDHNIEVMDIDPNEFFLTDDNAARLTWLGHSSFLIELGDKMILLDPVFGQYAAPHPWLGRQRFNSQMPIEISELPEVDAVIISHDHYDHLDYQSIKELKDKVAHFFVPLGVGNHLRRWKVADANISELDWWQEEMYGDLKIAFTPSRHMSGRGLTDQSATLWGSWVIQSDSINIFFSGDGGYGKHFKTIGEKYGPFDVGLMECGQYNELWADVHMMPEETALAAEDVNARLIVPIHWGSFALATHSWIDPVERILQAATAKGQVVATPQIGEPITIPGSLNKTFTQWWKE